MSNLTPEGFELVEQAARRHNVSTDAVLTLLQALNRGGGTQAQFSHPELGGMGQWSRGGMIMVGDMFNNGLKARVDSLCNDLSDMAYNNTLFLPETRNGSSGGSWGGGNWWPQEFGSPSSSGSQNDMSYACFPETRRLAIRRNGMVTLYDTGDHRIGGVSQQQSGSQDLTFTSQYGTIRLHELGLINDAPPGPVPQSPGYQAPVYQNQTLQAPMSEPPGHAHESSAQMSFADMAPPAMSSAPSFKPDDASPSENDIFAKIERLHSLQQKGILSEAEFAEKKKDLLSRI